MKFCLRNQDRCCCLSCVNVLLFLPGQHWCRHCRGSDSPARPGSLLASIPAAGGRLSWDTHPRRGLWCRHPCSTASPTVFLRDPWWCAVASRLGDGQDIFWTEILLKVSEDNVGGGSVGLTLFILLVLKMELSLTNGKQAYFTIELHPNPQTFYFMYVSTLFSIYSWFRAFLRTCALWQYGIISFWICARFVN